MKMAVHLRQLMPLAACVIILWIVFMSELLLNEKNPIRLAVNEPRCKIPILDPWDKTILSAVAKGKIPSCTWTPQLTYVEGNHLKVNLTMLNGKYNKTTMCEYQIIQRPSHKDSSIKLSKPLRFPMQRGTEIKDEFIKVSCYKSEKVKKLIYINYHVLVVDKGKNVENQTKREDGLINILLLGTDSMSHSAGIRYLPKTRKYLLDTLGATELFGYTKVGLNTFPNMVPFLTGLHQEEIAEPTINGPYDKYPLVFKKFSAAGYKTLFAEDMPDIGMFHYLKKGFINPPADHYFRPLSLAIKKEKKFPYKGCEKYVIESRLILDYLSKFVSKYQYEKPFFGLVFLTGLSHDDQTLSRRLDQLYEELFIYLNKIDIWKNTVLLFFGDHGARFGSILKSKVGRTEGNLPMMYVVLPRRFQHKYPEFSENLRGNSKRLTTPFDAHQTLLHLLSLRGNVTQAPSRHGISLLSEIPKNRTCVSAAIPLHFCTCYQQEKVDVRSALVYDGALFLVTEINTILKESRKVCSHLQLHNISSAVAFKSDDGFTFYRIIYTTEPGYGKFEGTIHFNQRGINNGTSDHGATMKPMFTTHGSKGRLNKYGNQSICTNIASHRLYCFCKDQVS